MWCDLIIASPASWIRPDQHLPDDPQPEVKGELKAVVIHNIWAHRYQMPKSKINKADINFIQN